MAVKHRQKDVAVKRGSDGLGLFAAQDIKRGDFVIEYVGERISNDEADKRGGKYLFDVNDRWTIDGTPRWNTARYINHACKPNCETREIKGRIKVYAKRAIKAGEELTYDYGKEYFDDLIQKKGCRCAACAMKKKPVAAPVK